MRGLTKRELNQLYYLNREIEIDEQRLIEIEDKIAEYEEQLEKLEQQLTNVPASKYNGMPKTAAHGSKLENDVVRLNELHSILQQKKDLRSECAKILQAKQLRCITERNKLEKYIQNIQNSFIRQIFTLRFIDGYSWEQIADRIGGRNTSESMRKTVDRYLQKS
jgi:hypothetical protein